MIEGHEIPFPIFGFKEILFWRSNDFTRHHCSWIHNPSLLHVSRFKQNQTKLWNTAKYGRPLQNCQRSCLSGLGSSPLQRKISSINLKTTVNTVWPIKNRSRLLQESWNSYQNSLWLSILDYCLYINFDKECQYCE